MPKKKKSKNPKNKKNQKDTEKVQRSAYEKASSLRENLAIAMVICILLGAISIVLFMFLNEMGIKTNIFGDLFETTGQSYEIPQTNIEIVIEEYEIYYDGQPHSLDEIRTLTAQYPDGCEQLQFDVVDSNAIKSVYDSIIQLMEDRSFNYREK